MTPEDSLGLHYCSVQREFSCYCKQTTLFFRFWSKPNGQNRFPQKVVFSFFGRTGSGSPSLPFARFLLLYFYSQFRLQRVYQHRALACPFLTCGPSTGMRRRDPYKTPCRSLQRDVPPLALHRDTLSTGTPVQRERGTILGTVHAASYRAEEEICASIRDN